VGGTEFAEGECHQKEENISDPLSHRDAIPRHGGTCEPKSGRSPTRGSCQEGGLQQCPLERQNRRDHLWAKRFGEDNLKKNAGRGPYFPRVTGEVGISKGSFCSRKKHNESSKKEIKQPHREEHTSDLSRITG